MENSQKALAYIEGFIQATLDEMDRCLYGPEVPEETKAMLIKEKLHINQALDVIKASVVMVDAIHDSGEGEYIIIQKQTLNIVEDKEEIAQILGHAGQTKH